MQVNANINCYHISLAISQSHNVENRHYHQEQNTCGHIAYITWRRRGRIHGAHYNGHPSDGGVVTGKQTSPSVDDEKPRGMSGIFRGPHDRGQPHSHINVSCRSIEESRQTFCHGESYFTPPLRSIILRVFLSPETPRDVLLNRSGVEENWGWLQFGWRRMQWRRVRVYWIPGLELCAVVASSIVEINSSFLEKCISQWIGSEFRIWECFKKVLNDKSPFSINWFVEIKSFIKFQSNPSYFSLRLLFDSNRLHFYNSPSLTYTPNNELNKQTHDFRFEGTGWRSETSQREGHVWEPGSSSKSFAVRARSGSRQRLAVLRQNRLLRAHSSPPNLEANGSKSQIPARDSLSTCRPNLRSSARFANPRGRSRASLPSGEGWRHRPLLPKVQSHWMVLRALFRRSAPATSFP